jgi:hypothetical protein
MGELHDLPQRKVALPKAKDGIAQSYIRGPECIR